VCIGLGCSFALACSLSLLAFRKPVACAFTSDEAVQAVVSNELLPPLALYVIADALQVCCGGVLQGCGLQRKGFPFVLAAYYLVGLPLGCALGFRADMGARGMVLGMLCGKLCHATAFVSLVLRTQWAVQLRDSAARVAGEQSLSSGTSAPPQANESVSPRPTKRFTSMFASGRHLNGKASYNGVSDLRDWNAEMEPAGESYP